MPDNVQHEEGELEYVKLIVKGDRNEVWEAKWKDRMVAAKRINDKYFNGHYQTEIIQQYTEELKKEWQVLRNLVHPNILRMYTVLFPPNRSPVIVTELLECDLRSFISKSTTTPKVLPHQVKLIALGVAEGLEYLHSFESPIVHRDLATKNILLTADGHPKIADVGNAKVFFAGKDDYASTNPGTPVYSAPETHPALANNFGEARYGVKVDIFSFGVVLMVLIIGHEPRVISLTPLKGGKKGGKLSLEMQRRKQDIDEMGNHSLKQLVLDCLLEKSSKRPSANQIVKKLHECQLCPTDNGSHCGASATSFPGPQIPDTNENVPMISQQCSFEKVSSQYHYDHKFKVLLIGNSGVGKTCLLQKLRDPGYNHTSSVATLGIDPWKQAFKYNSKFVELQIVDTAGQEQFFSIQPLYFRDIQGMFLVFDVTSQFTFEKLNHWIAFAKQYFSEKCVHVILVGNKVDCKDRGMKVKRDISNQQGQEFADKHGYPYVETSVTNEYADTIMAMYEKMVEMLIQTADPEAVHVAVKASKDTVKLEDTCNSKSKCPCSRSFWS